MSTPSLGIDTPSTSEPLSMPHTNIDIPPGATMLRASAASSHVNTMSTSPPTQLFPSPPSTAVSQDDSTSSGAPVSTSPPPVGVIGVLPANAQPPVSPTSASASQSSPPPPPTQHLKPHPADLVCRENPDPHQGSGSATPIEEKSGMPAETPSRGSRGSLDGDEARRKDGTDVDEGEEGVESENEVTVGHGDEEATLAEEDSPTTTAINGVIVPSGANGVEESHSRRTIDANTPLRDAHSTSSSSKAPISDDRRDSPSLGEHGVERRRTGESSRHRSGSSAGATNEQRDRERRHGRREKEGGTSTGAAAGTSSSGRSRRTLGEYTMGKTLGAGSMGKVKLGVSSVSGEKVAIKIIPRFTSVAAAMRPPAPATTPAAGANGDAGTDPTPAAPSAKDAPPVKPTASFIAKATAKDQSKEIRTMREGSLVLLLHHPYVCGMKSMMLYPNHYYMVFEYVNGGQMLDYIISHGRLRERSARKFARQIGSALEYCHANSIVHRDLKIENILISKTGNIKIIDFGLSNLYSPGSHLSTFCGSLYFAAPELLNAKPYIGPEVDIWSFGIVLYVLVCGKVPFDDQSMPALHAKIKRGQVEYPTWLSAECKHLLSRMLVTNPSSRATLQEVLNHPWVVKGFPGPPSSHLPARTPLRPEEIDREVVKGMTGFELGTDEEIFDNLVDVLVTDAYRSAVKSWESRRQTVPAGPDSDGDYVAALSEKERPATRVDGRDMKGLGRSPTNKRFSGIGFYGKKIAGGLNAAFASSGGTGGAHKSNEGDLGDHSNSSSGSLGGGSSSGQREPPDPTRGFHPLISLYYLVKEKMEREKIYGPGVFASSTLSLNGPPPPPAPAMAYQQGSAAAPAAPIGRPSLSAAVIEPSRPPVASPNMPLTPQPRQRATGEEYGRAQQAALQAPRTDDYRYNKRSSFHPSQSASASMPTSPSLTGAFQPQASYEPSTPTRTQPGSSPVDPDDVPLSSSPSGFARRFGSLLGRSSPTNDQSNASYKGHRQRASIATSSHRASTKTAVAALPQVNETSIRASGSDVPLPSPSEGKAVARASTIGELSPNRHHRGISMGAGPTPSSSGSNRAGEPMERRRLSSMGAADETGAGVPPVASNMPRPRTSGDVQGMFDEAQEEILSDSSDRPARQEEHAMQQQQDVGFVGRAQAGGSEQAKPVWLKGLFSVTTTTTRSAATIRTDLIRVLERLGVQFRDVKSGFECAHVPSIDLSSIGGGGGKKDASHSGKGGTIRRRASKLLLRDKDQQQNHDAEDSMTSLNGGGHGGGGQQASSSSFDRISPVTETNPAATHGTSNAGGSPNASNGPKFSAVTDSSSVSSDLIVRFEIFIVKMPLLPGINGLQFRRIGGNAWQYQMLAKRVLSELKL